MQTNTIEALPFPPSFVFPDVDDEILAREGWGEFAFGANAWTTFIDRLLLPCEASLPLQS